MSQTDMILRDLKRGKAITPIDALREYQCFRLAAREADLREQGHDIVTDEIVKDGKRYASYRLASRQPLGAA